MRVHVRARRYVYIYFHDSLVLPFSQLQNKTSRRLNENDTSFIKNEPSFYAKQHDVFNKTTRRFMRNDTSFSILEIKIQKQSIHRPMAKSEEYYDVVKTHLLNRFYTVLLFYLIAWWFNRKSVLLPHRWLARDSARIVFPLPCFAEQAILLIYIHFVRKTHLHQIPTHKMACLFRRFG